jgi:hypothetical protein
MDRRPLTLDLHDDIEVAKVVLELGVERRGEDSRGEERSLLSPSHRLNRRYTDADPVIPKKYTGSKKERKKERKNE